MDMNAIFINIWSNIIFSIKQLINGWTLLLHTKNKYRHNYSDYWTLEDIYKCRGFQATESEPSEMSRLDTEPTTPVHEALRHRGSYVILHTSY